MNRQPTGYGSIYALVDPREPEHVRYIGWTSKSLEARLSGHLNDVLDARHRSYKRNWLASLRKKGVLPEIVLVERVHSSEWAAKERFWIAAMKEEGDRLTNTTGGGDGNYGVPKELFLQWAAKRRGRKHTPESILKMRLAKLGKKRSVEANRKASEKMKGRTTYKMTDEIRKKISMTLTGRKRATPYTEEQIEKYRSAARKREAKFHEQGGKIVSTETRKKLSDSGKRSWKQHPERKSGRYGTGRKEKFIGDAPSASCLI